MLLAFIASSPCSLQRERAVSIMSVFVIFTFGGIMYLLWITIVIYQMLFYHKKVGLSIENENIL